MTIDVNAEAKVGKVAAMVSELIAQHAIVSADDKRFVDDGQPLVDMNFVLNVLVTVTAHHIAGIPGEERSAAYSYFGAALAANIVYLLDGDASFRAKVVLPRTGKDTVQ